MFVLSSEHKDIYFRLFMRQGKLSGWRNIYESEKNHNILQDRLNGFPLREPYIYVFDRCVRWAYICVHCVSQKVWVWATVVCVCSWMCKRQGWKRNLKAALSICFLHHCGGITLSIVGSLGISSVCNISLIHTSLWALPSRETQSPPWHCADPAHPLRLSPVWYHGSVRSTRDVKMSDSRL